MSDTCRQGHPWTPENTGQRRNGKRWCRACQVVRAKLASERRQGKPCLNCGRTGLFIAAGGWCNTCAKRRARGLPLDAPIATPIHGADDGVPALDPAAKVQRERKPAKRGKAKSNLPAGWFNVKAAREQNRPGLTPHALPEIGPVEAPPEATVIAARRVLAHYDALDLAEMLGVAS